MDFEQWLSPPTADWAGTLVGLALGLISAAAALYASVATAWTAALQAAIDGTMPKGIKLDPATAEGARAMASLDAVRRGDPAHGLGIITLAVTVMMAILGLIGGLQIPDVGWLYTVVPVVVATSIAGGSMFLPGRQERRTADSRLTEMRGPG